MFPIEQIFIKADDRQRNNVPAEEQALKMGVDVLRCIEEAQQPDMAVRILFKMFERYK